MAMLSRNQQRKLLKIVYGRENQYTSQIKRMYRNADHRVKAEMSAFLMSQANWSAPARKEQIATALDDLGQFDDDVQPLTSYYASSLTLGHPKQGDVVTAMVAVPLIGIASKLHKMVSHTGGQVPREVRHTTMVQNKVTPKYHKVPPKYDLILQRTVSRAVTRQEQVHTTINRDIQSTISRIKAVCKKASQDTDAKHDYTADVDRILNGKDGKGGSAAMAQTIMRTETSRQLNSATIDDMKARGVQKYRFLSLEAETTCEECASMDGNEYDVDDAEEGVNLPPIHPNCHCWIEDVQDTDIDDLPTLEEMMNDDDFE